MLLAALGDILYRGECRWQTHAAHIHLGLRAVICFALVARGAQLLLCMRKCLQDSMQAGDK